MEPEMDCAAQGARLTAPFLRDQSARLLDVGCGGGHFYHSLRRRGLDCDYWGLDYSPSIVKAAKYAFGRLGLELRRIILGDVAYFWDFPIDVAVMINVLTFNPDFRAPLERLVEAEAQAIIIRDNFGPKTVIRWEEDGYLDPVYNHLKGYWNQWSRKEVAEFLKDRGFECEFIRDDRTKGRIELVVDKPYRWSWLVAQKGGL
jgi:SAM-dependent methyltransferase